jgi:hypothetical protein
MVCHYCQTSMRPNGQIVTWRPGTIEAQKIGLLECPRCHNTVMQPRKWLVWAYVKLGASGRAKGCEVAA